MREQISQKGHQFIFQIKLGLSGDQVSLNQGQKLYQLTLQESINVGLAFIFTLLCCYIFAKLPVVSKNTAELSSNRTQLLGYMLNIVSL